MHPLLFISVIQFFLLLLCSNLANTQVYRYEKRLDVNYTWPKRYQTSEIDTTSCTEFTYQLWRNSFNDENGYDFIDHYYQTGLDPNCTVLVHSTYVKPPLYRSEKESGTIHWKATPFQLACSFGNVKMIEKMLQYEPNPNREVACCFDSIGKRINSVYMPVLEVALDNKWVSNGDGTKVCRQDSSVYNYLTSHGVWSENKKKDISDQLMKAMNRYRNSYFSKEKVKIMSSIQSYCDSIGKIQLRDARYIFKQSMESNIPFVQHYLFENQERLDKINFTRYIEAPNSRKGLFNSKPTYIEEVIPWKLFIIVYPEFPLIETVEYFYNKGMLNDADLKQIAQLKKSSKQGIKEQIKGHYKNGGKLFQKYYHYYFQIKELDEGSSKRKKLEQKMLDYRKELQEMNG